MLSRSKSTTNKSGKPTLGTFLFGLPEFETLFHLLKRLNERGQIKLKIVLPSSLCRIEPRIPELLTEARMTYRVIHSKTIKYFYRRSFRGMNAVLGISDPYMDIRRTHRRRNRYLVNLNIASIFFQHGVIQDIVNHGSPSMWGYPMEQIDYYSIAAFLMEYPSQDQQKFFTKSALERVDISGFIKKPCFTPNSVESRIASQLSNYDTRLLICHSLRTGTFAKEDVRNFYSMIRKFASDNPQIGVIVRPHRGKRRQHYESYDRKMDKQCNNVHFMYHHHGPLKRMTISDALSISDMMISTPSTAILDAVYMGKPTAVSMNNHEIFADLCQISDANSIEQFVGNKCNHRDGAENLIARYGKLDENLERTCSKIERIVRQVAT